MKALSSSRTIPLIFALVGLVVSSPAMSQTVRGHVADSATGAPIQNATVLLLDLTGRTLKLAVTDAAGTYTIQVPNPGSYTFRVDAVGYNTHNEIQFSVAGGRVLELDMSLVGYTELAPVTVSAESLPSHSPLLQGFYERKERGRGQFITREDIDLVGASRFTEILRATPTVEVVALGGTLYTIRIKGAGRIGGDCPPQLWVDNVRWGSVDLGGDGPDRDLIPSEIEAIEVYRPTSVPIEFAAFDLSCGVVVVWTKRAP